MGRRWGTLDGNEAAARVAYRTNEVIAIYPITPASPMGEWSDAWAAEGLPNIWGAVPEVAQMQSEGGAAGACHGALQAGALSTTFTASQGLLLMLPNMFKIAGELTPAVIHVAARTVATHALSIFGDHSDVMAVRSAGWGMLASNSVQEAQDFALISQAATLASRVPFLHFFDGFRTSHEVNKVELLEDDDLRHMIDDDLVRAHRERSLDPDRPVLRGTAQNPDVFFQAREAINPFYDSLPSIVRDTCERFGKLTGRHYGLFDYHGAPDAERVVVLMGSGVGAAREAVEALCQQGEKVGLVVVRLFRPFSAKDMVNALPDTVREIAVLDRTKEPGAAGEPLYQDVVTAVHEEWGNGERRLPKITGGRYGLSSKEFTPAMVSGLFSAMAEDRLGRGFTVGIVDDVTHTSVPWDASFSTEPADVKRAVFFGLGSDGTVGANKNSVKILGSLPDMHAQGYFVYDSKKSGSTTVSHLRFGPRPIESSYLIREAGFVACHQFEFLEKIDVLNEARRGATFLLNSPYGPDEVWGRIPVEVQRQILQKELRLFVIDATAVAKDAGLGNRINTVMQTCFFALSDVLPPEQALEKIRESVQSTYGKRGESVVRRNLDAVEKSQAALHAVKIPESEVETVQMRPPITEGAPDFVQRVTSMIVAGKGDLLPVSAMPVDGTFPVGTARYEKRSIALEIPIWDASICIQCALCSLVCPHAAIRMKMFSPPANGRPKEFQTLAWRGKEMDGAEMAIQVAPDDCTGCGVCVDVCPALDKENVSHKSINMEPKDDHLERERTNFDYFLTLKDVERGTVALNTVKGTQTLEPLFEFSGACAGCGETPYVKLLSQLFGDRALVANATGCSSIYGGNLPTTPWSANAEGRGPAWSNSLFEDNAEFGFGMRLAVEQATALARTLLREYRPQLDGQVVDALLEARIDDEEALRQQRARIATVKTALAANEDPRAKALVSMVDVLAGRSVWIVGGDGWAYDIGFGGLDHVLASGRNVNVLVLDTEVYSNTGGQASKATPLGAVAKFAAGGKRVGKKDLGMIAMAYGHVYVAEVAMGANPSQTVKAFIEAESYDGPSLLIAYSPCIAHGIDMSKSMSHQKEAVNSGYWPLYRFDPRDQKGEHHLLRLDSRKPKIPFLEFAMKEGRFAMLERSAPDVAKQLFGEAQREIDQRFRLYTQMADVERTVTLPNQAADKPEGSEK